MRGPEIAFVSKLLLYKAISYDEFDKQWKFDK